MDNNAANDGKICQQPGGNDRGKNSPVDGREEESGHAVVPHAAGVSLSDSRDFTSQFRLRNDLYCVEWDVKL